MTIILLNQRYFLFEPTNTKLYWTENNTLIKCKTIVNNIYSVVAVITGFIND